MAVNPVLQTEQATLAPELVIARRHTSIIPETIGLLSCQKVIDLETQTEVHIVQVNDPLITSVEHEANRQHVKEVELEGIVEVQEYTAEFGPLDKFKFKEIGDEQKDNPQNSPFTTARYLFSKDTKPGLYAWYKSRGSARALYPLQNPYFGELPDGTPITDQESEYIAHVTDADGIRGRAAIMVDVVTEHLEKSSKKNPKLLSIACGAAVPVIQLSQHLIDRGINPELTLLDNDVDTLNFGRTLLEEANLLNNSTIHEEDVLGGFVRKAITENPRLGEILKGQKFDTVDILGFLEYLPPRMSANLIKNSFSLLEDNGIIVLGNMRDTHPAIDFHHGIVRWPGVQQRSLKDIIQIINQAEIPSSASVDFYQASDGVYNVAVIKNN